MGESVGERGRRHNDTGVGFDLGKAVMALAQRHFPR